MSAPICRIELPSHHPAVAGLKKGEAVHIMATKHEMPPSPFADKDADDKNSPPSLTTPFHVNSIEKAPKVAGNKQRTANNKAQSPMQYLASRRRQPAGESADTMS